jgi:hypothetical protein
VDDAHAVSAEHPVLLEPVGEQLLAHQLVQRLVQHVGERQRGVDGTGRIRPGSAVPLPAHRVLRRVGTPSSVGLGVLPLQQHQLGEAIHGPVQERRVDARAVRTPHSFAVGDLAEVVVRADVLEGQVTARLDLQHLRRAERLGEGADEPLGVVHHLREGVDALHL